MFVYRDGRCSEKGCSDGTFYACGDRDIKKAARYATDTAMTERQSRQGRLVQPIGQIASNWYQLTAAILKNIHARVIVLEA